MSKKNELLIRLYTVLIFVVIVSILLFAKAAKISVVEGERWRTKGDSLYLKYIPVEADRGNILSDDGGLLATSLPFFEIRMDLRAAGLKEDVFRKNVDSLAWYLSRYANPQWSPVRYRNYLVQQRAKGNRYLLIKKGANYGELERFKKFPIFRLGRNTGGMIVERRSQRAMPYRDLAARTLGSVREGIQPVGLEGYFDDKLAGEEGRRLMQRVSGGTWIPVTDLSEIEAKRGMDVVTTINIRYQDILHNSLQRAVEHHNAKFGTAVLMEVKTGAIKAIANIGKTPNGYGEDYNYAVGSSLEPGSTMKLASVMALMEDGYADLDTAVDLSQGYVRYYSRDLYDSGHHGLDMSTMRKAFEISSNVGISRLVFDNYEKGHKAGEFIARLKQFGLDRTTGIMVPGEGKPYIKDAYNTEQSWSGTTLPWMSIGYELQVTPLQMLRFYNAVANDGKMMKPYIVDRIVKDGDRVVEKFEPRVEIERIASEETIGKARELLEGVALRGTASDKPSKLVSFAGKTGTARIEYFLNNDRKKYQSTFAGYFPAEDPQYSCIVLIYDPKQNGYYGSAVALPVFMEMAERLAVINYENPAFERVDTTIQKENNLREYPAISCAYKSDVQALVKALDLPEAPLPESDWLSIKVDPEWEVSGRNMLEKIIPNLTGMGLRDAVFVIENAGMKVKTKGVGKVKQQVPRPGSPIIRGGEIELLLG